MVSTVSPSIRKLVLLVMRYVMAELRSWTRPSESRARAAPVTPRPTHSGAGAYRKVRVLGPDPQRLGGGGGVFDLHACSRASCHSPVVPALGEVGRAPGGISGLNCDPGHRVAGVVCLLALGWGRPQ